MLLQKLQLSYSKFLEYCEGAPFSMNLGFEEICDRLKVFNEINSELMAIEIDYRFSEISEEICYYKHEKSEFQKYGIFYERVYHIELRKRPKEWRYYKELLNKYDKQFEEIEPFVIYYRSKSIEKDAEYFRKTSPNNAILSLVKAHEMLVKYLNHKAGGKTADEIIASSPKVKFHLKQNDVIEIAKGLKGISAADGTLKEIAETLGRVFGVDMKDIHSKSHVVSHRLNPARFLEKMSQYLKKGS